jgi:3,4-dehydroadipyl-CoA semialdehyde dehydrogenase
MQQLSSYLMGAWCAGNDEGSPLYDPTTEAIVARASTAGLPIGAAMAYARETGGPTLRAMTFAQRGALLAAMSKAIHAKREELIEMGRVNAGNTRGDAKFDIDGATGTLMYYAKLGEALGDLRLLPDGEAIKISGARLVGQHILAPRAGVAVHINAFNFPAWGLAEKAACAILAGMPVMSKPGTATALMAWGVVQAVAEAGVLPDGVLSFVCGPARDLLDHVNWADVVAFTGGAQTVARIRQHPRVLAVQPRLNIEADSLNAALLVPDAADATYDCFIRDLHREMTQKAGQKCTATRRVLVPHDLVDEVIEDVGERLERTVVGAPDAEGVRMGPLASAAQLASAQSGIAALREEADVVWGDPDGGPLKGVEPGKGYFQTPLLLRARDPQSAQIIHDLEVFGPVCTLVPYDGTPASATALIQRGKGGLVASVYGDDRPFLRAAIHGLAGYHGRVVVTDGKVADMAMSPGIALPHLLHGGPGRAGDGQELGGLRGLTLYQQRCAIQGNGSLLARLLEG